MPSDKQIQFEFCDGKPGLGKTTHACKLMAKLPGKYLYAVDRREVFNVRADLIRAESANFSQPDIVFINANNVHLDGVKATIQKVPFNYEGKKHIVVIITHEGLMTSDLGGFHGWHLIIDEKPQVWQMEQVNSPETNSIYKKYFQIKDGYIHLRSTKNAKDLRVDDGLSDKLLNLYNAVRNGKVQCNCNNFVEARWAWWSVYDFTNFAPFKSVKILANAFSSSLAYNFMEKVGIELVRLDWTRANSDYKPRRLIINYFDEHNSCSRSFFSQSEIGRAALKAVGEYLENVEVDIWSCNKKSEDGFNPYDALKKLSGRHLSPAVAGSNEFKNKTHGAFIYSAKPSTEEVSRLGQIGISRADIIRDRETETIVQFITRLSLRQPDDDRDCVFYLYDKEQAEAVKKCFEEMDMNIEVVLNYINVGIPEASKGRGKGKSNLTSEERKARRASYDKARAELKKQKSRHIDDPIQLTKNTSKEEAKIVS